ncbi:MAG: DUF1501 domain-containing protein [Planctomycetota bacterium]|nr:DUF1501 domain-containing protein [Planctomycetota bacterium]MDA1211511.1 DUF1501 domain-containing protein [Planctomycetota bacterium]
MSRSPFKVPQFSTDHNERGRGFSRRDVLQIGGLSLFSGMNVPRLLRAADATIGNPERKAKSVILFNLLGGPSHQDMFDLKPEAPVEVRGEFRPIDTSLSGLQICEHMPGISRIMHRAALIRSVTHGYNAHNPLPIMTGYSGGPPGQLKNEATDPPDIGAVCQFLNLGPSDMPGAVCLPCYPGWGESSAYPGIRRPGPYGGYLGNQYDPLFSVCEPKYAKREKYQVYDPVVPMCEPMLPKVSEATAHITREQIQIRRRLLERIDEPFEVARRSSAIHRMQHFQDRAFDMLTSSRVRDAFDLNLESDTMRNQYGRNLFGSSMLTARRLVEAGVPYISIHAENFIPYCFTYDMHQKNFSMLKDFNLPILDQLLPALVIDLDERGLLDSTVVMVMGEMGRTPKISDKAGRDHWPQCGFCLLIGGGIKEGTVYGKSDKQAAYPTENPTSPADIVCTLYHLLGIDPHTMVPDALNRPRSIAHDGKVIWDILA